MPYCAKCGASVGQDVTFCPSCGSPVGMPSASQGSMSSPQAFSTMDQMRSGRPTGITILAILEGLGGLLLLFGALAIFALSAVGYASSGTGGFLVGAVGGAIAVFLVLLALITFAVAYSFWTGKPWGWWLGIILSGLQIISGLITFPAGILNVALGVIILYYLTRPYVKIWFHKA